MEQRRHKGLKKKLRNIIFGGSRSRSLNLLLILWKTIRNSIFSTWLWSNYGIMSKKNFQSKNSNWSKQTAAKVCLQDRRRGFLLHIVSNFSTWKKFNTSKSTSAQLTSICDLLAGNIIFTKNFKTFCNLGLYIIIYTI